MDKKEIVKQFKESLNDEILIKIKGEIWIKKEIDVTVSESVCGEFEEFKKRKDIIILKEKGTIHRGGFFSSGYAIITFHYLERYKINNMTKK